MSHELQSAGRIARYAVACTATTLSSTADAGVVSGTLASPLVLTSTAQFIDLSEMGGLNGSTQFKFYMPGPGGLALEGQNGAMHFQQTAVYAPFRVLDSGDVMTAGDTARWAISGSSSWWFGSSKNVVDGTKFVGFRVDFGGNNYKLGFFELLIANNKTEMTVMGWAYESELNTNITAMSISGNGGGTPAVPGLGGLAALAMGAAGVRRNRQRVA